MVRSLIHSTSYEIENNIFYKNPTFATEFVYALSFLRFRFLISKTLHRRL